MHVGLHDSHSLSGVGNKLSLKVSVQFVSELCGTRSFRAGLEVVLACAIRIAVTQHGNFHQPSTFSPPRVSIVLVSAEWNAEPIIGASVSIQYRQYVGDLRASHHVDYCAAPQGYAASWGFRGRKVQAQPSLSRSQWSSHLGCRDGRVCVRVLSCRKGKFRTKVSYVYPHKQRIWRPQAVKRGFSWCAHRETCLLWQRIRPTAYQRV